MLFQTYRPSQVRLHEFNTDEIKAVKDRLSIYNGPRCMSFLVCNFYNFQNSLGNSLF